MARELCDAMSLNKNRSVKIKQRNALTKATKNINKLF